MSRPYYVVYLLFCAFIAITVWMLAYALILQVVWKDGRILHMMTTTNPLAPFQQLAAYFSNRPLQLVAAGAAIPAIGAGIGVGLAVGAAVNGKATQYLAGFGAGLFAAAVTITPYWVVVAVLELLTDVNEGVSWLTRFLYERSEDETTTT